MPLRRVKKATLTAFEMHPQARLQDDFAWRVKMTAHLILFPPFLIQGEKGVRCASGTRIAPTEPAGENARRGMSDKVED